MFRQLGIKSVKLYTNNPEKMKALQPIVKETAALASVANERNAAYLKTKIEKLNHKTVLDTFQVPAPQIDASRLRIGIVFTLWNQYYVDELLRRAESELGRQGATAIKVSVPGALELIGGARAMIRKNAPDAVIVLGVMIRGSSDVYEVSCNAVMTGLTNMNANQDIPIISGLLMCQNEDQAHQRSHGPSNAGKALAETAIHMGSMKLNADVERYGESDVASYEFQRQRSPVSP